MNRVSYVLIAMMFVAVLLGCAKREIIRPVEPVVTTDELQGRINNLEKEIVDLGRKLDTRKQENSRLRSDNQRKDGVIEDLASRVDSLIKAKDALREDLAKTSNSRRRLAVANRRLRADVGSLNNVIVGLEYELADSSKIISGFRDELAALNDTLAVRNSIITDMEEQLADMTKSRGNWKLYSCIASIFALVFLIIALPSRRLVKPPAKNRSG